MIRALPFVIGFRAPPFDVRKSYAFPLVRHL
jgi:hypothetical protein